MSTPPQPTPGTLDWSVGSYEHVAEQLLPAAREVVERAQPTPGEQVLDVGCGTGNAALLAAARGARVVGVDPASRLLEVAQDRAKAAGLDATFVSGRAEAVPLEDGRFDAVLSVFGVIFASPADAVAELARVTAPHGRIVLSAWVPGGAISDAVRVAQAAVRRALGAPEGPPPFAWHDPSGLAGLLSPHGFEVEVTEHPIAFTADSARDYLDEESAKHPLSVAGRAILDGSGEGDAVRQRMLAIYEAGNEDPGGFRVTSRYVVATARRGRPAVGRVRPTARGRVRAPQS
jgi:SAM-dependent methyltransferase